MHSASSCKDFACTLECDDCFEMFETFDMIRHVEKLLHTPCSTTEQPSAILRASLTLLIDSVCSLASPSCSLNNHQVFLIIRQVYVAHHAKLIV